MKIIKIAAALACSLLIALFATILKVENPETALYKQTIEILMEQEGVTSEQEIEKRFPILTDIRERLNEIAEMNQFILSKTRNPAPVLTEAEALQLIHYLKMVPELREGVRTNLTQLVANYTAFQP